MASKHMNFKYGKIKYIPNPAAPRLLLNGNGMVNYIERRRSHVQAAANAKKRKKTAKYAGDTQKGQKRCHGLVWTANLTAAFDNEQNNTLLKSLRSGQK